MRIGIDLMGSDSSPTVLFEAILLAAAELAAEDSLVVYLTEAALEAILAEEKGTEFSPHSLSFSYNALIQSRIDIRFVTETIEMTDDPLSAIRLKRGSSLVSGILQLKEKKIDAFVSAGNTGALIASATLFLSRIPGIERPCLLALLPTQENPLVMVDVGGSLVSDAALLVQYARLGAAYQRCVSNKTAPTVALLNVGVESKKGTREVREAFRILQEEGNKPGAKLTFLGNLEGREVFQGKVDVLVTDGFSGNVMLKASEGVSSFIFESIQTVLKEGASDEMREMFGRLKRHFSYDEYPGAIVIGAEGIVIKCHGAATVRGMLQSIRGAKTLVHNQFLAKLKQELKI